VQGPLDLVLATADVVVGFGCSILHKLQKALAHVEHCSPFAKQKLGKDQCQLE
jgi:hypothetical protein